MGIGSMYNIMFFTFPDGYVMVGAMLLILIIRGHDEFNQLRLRLWSFVSWRETIGESCNSKSHTTAGGVKDSTGPDSQASDIQEGQARTRTGTAHTVEPQQEENLKSMVSAGLASLSCNYDLLSSVYAKNTLKVLCIRHGGGSFPLFLAFKIPEASSKWDSILLYYETTWGPVASETDYFDEILWKVVQERLHLYESDAEQFITDRTNIYDMVFVDAYDGDDVFPHKLWDPDSIFLKALEWLHPDHGTVVADIMDTDHQNRGKIEDPPPKAVLDHLVIQKLNAEGRLEKKEAKKEVGLTRTKANVEHKGAEEEAGHELLSAFKGDYQDLQPSKNHRPYQPALDVSATAYRPCVRSINVQTTIDLNNRNAKPIRRCNTFASPLWLGIATVTVLCYICARVPIT
ncbi:hypothetical protein Tco_0482117 [Tanacetum coccineum]